MSKKIISIITAMDNQQLIGRENALPWRLPADLQFFKSVTMGKPVVMGRKTFESIGRALPGRQNIVITRDTGFTASDCDVVLSVEQAIQKAASEEVMVIGGSSIYQQVLPLADKLYITRVLAEFEGDAWFPAIDFTQWRLLEKEDHKADDKNECDYSFEIYERVKPA